MREQKELYNGLNRKIGLDEIQHYIKQVMNLRGFEHQPVEQILLLLTEEIGELAKAIRKEKIQMAIDQEKIDHYHSVQEEIADVFLVLNALCNSLDINLYDAFHEKEEANIERTWKK